MSETIQIDMEILEPETITLKEVSPIVIEAEIGASFLPELPQIYVGFDEPPAPSADQLWLKRLIA